MTFIKYCGITNYEDAKAALDVGADALGFNFYTRSPRYVSPLQAQLIVRRLPASVWFVGVFVDATRRDIEGIARSAGLDSLQFHGNEPEELLDGWDSWRVLRAMRLKSGVTAEELRAVAGTAEYLLLDSFSTTAFGGTGVQIDAETLQRVQEAGLFSKTFLSGGITPENVEEKVRNYRPFAVDVASGIESAPGKKDIGKMKAFADAVRKANS